MTRPVTISLLGSPVGFARMRLSRLGSHFVPPHQRNAAAALRLAAEQAMRESDAVMFDEPVRLDLQAEFAPPASWSKRKQQAALIGLYHPPRPDLDNVYKLAADALSAVVFRDDSLVAELHARKIYGVQPKLVITVHPLLRPALRAEAAE